MLKSSGDPYGEIIEHSFVRRDDFDSNKSKNSTHDVLNLGTPVPAGSRGHQLAAAVSIGLLLVFNNFLLIIVPYCCLWIG